MFGLALGLLAVVTASPITLPLQFMAFETVLTSDGHFVAQLTITNSSTASIASNLTASVGSYSCNATDNCASAEIVASAKSDLDNTVAAMMEYTPPETSQPASTLFVWSCEDASLVSQCSMPSGVASGVRQLNYRPGSGALLALTHAIRPPNASSPWSAVMYEVHMVPGSTCNVTSTHTYLLPPPPGLPTTMFVNLDPHTLDVVVFASDPPTMTVLAPGGNTLKACPRVGAWEAGKFQSTTRVQVNSTTNATLWFTSVYDETVSTVVTIDPTTCAAVNNTVLDVSAASAWLDVVLMSPEEAAISYVFVDSWYIVNDFMNPIKVAALPRPPASQFTWGITNRTFNA